MGLFDDIIDKPKGGMFDDIVTPTAPDKKGLFVDKPNGIFADIVEKEDISFGPIESAKEIGKAALRMPQHMAASVGKMMNFIGEYDPRKSWLNKIGASSELTKMRDAPSNWNKIMEGSVGKMLRHQGKKIANFWEQAATTGIEAPSRKLGKAKWYQAPITKALTSAVESSGPFLSAIAAGVITKNPQIGLVLMGSLSTAETHYGLRKGGVDQEIAQNIGVLAGAWEAATEAVPFDVIFNKPAKTMLKTFLKAGTVESLQEFVQGIGENWLTHLGYNIKKGDWSSVPKAARIEFSELMNGWFENITAGFLLGGGAGAVVQKMQGTDFGPQAGPPEPTGPIEPAAPTDMVAPTDEVTPVDEVVRELKDDVLTQEQFERELAGEEVTEQPIDEVQEQADAPETVEVVPETTVDKFTRILGETKQLTEQESAQRKAEITKEKGIRAGEAAEVLKQGPEEELLYSALNRLKGEYKTVPTFQPLKETGEITADEIGELRASVRNNDKLGTFEKINTEIALNKIFEKGKLPTDGEIRLLEKHFGEAFAKAVRKRRAKGQKAWDGFFDAINAPRTLLASMDASAMGRQGIMLAPMHPKLWSKALLASWKLLFSPKSLELAHQMETDQRTSEHANLAIESGIAFTQWEGVSRPMSKREEGFMSNLAESIPGLGRLIKRSERSYVIALNKLRLDVFSYHANQWAGTNKTAADYQHLADLINYLTGRGDIGFLRKAAPALNGLFFSPKFVASRIQVLSATGEGAIRSIRSGEIDPVFKIAVSNLAGFVGSGMMILALAALALGEDAVEIDPRSSDFGKIRIGDTRIDFWAGYTPIIRLVTQLATGQRKVTDTGRISDVDANDVIWRFIQSKFAPPTALAADLIKGKNWQGEEMRLDVNTVLREARNRLVPLAMQDIADAIQYQGLGHGMAVAPLAFHGIGAQTYPISPSKLDDIARDRVANEVFGENWDELGPLLQKALRENRPEIDLAEMKAKSEREGVPYLDKMLQEQADTGKRISESLPEDTQQVLSDLFIKTGGVGRRIGSNWWLNDKRYKAYEQDVSRVLNKVLPRITRHGKFKRLTDDQKRKILEKLISKSKEAARKKIIQEARMKDLISTKKLMERGYATK